MPVDSYSTGRYFLNAKFAEVTELKSGESKSVQIENSGNDPLDIDWFTVKIDSHGPTVSAVTIDKTDLIEKIGLLDSDGKFLLECTEDVPSKGCNFEIPESILPIQYYVVVKKRLVLKADSIPFTQNPHSNPPHPGRRGASRRAVRHRRLERAVPRAGG